MMKNFTDFEKWKIEAKAQGCSVKLVTKAKTNSYYQARFWGSMQGFFNTGLKQGTLNVDAEGAAT